MHRYRIRFQPDNWNAAITVFGVALMVRVLNLIALADDPTRLMIEDSPVYAEGARAWLETGEFVRRTIEGYVPEVERVPLYFLLLMVIKVVFGDSLLAVAAVQAVIDAATCVVIFRLGEMLDRPTGLVVGALAALWPNLIIHSAYILTDTLFVFWMSLLLLFSARFLQRGATADAALAGIACGLGLATRTIAQFLPPVMTVVVFLIALKHGRGLRIAAIAAVLFAVGAVLPITPVLYRNITTFDTFALSTQGGGHALQWVYPRVRRAADGTPLKQTQREIDQLLAERRAALGAAYDSDNPFSSSRLQMGLARELLAEMPLSAFLRTWAQGIAVNLGAPAIAVDPRVRALRRTGFSETSGDGLLSRLARFLRHEPLGYTLLVSAGLVGSAIALAFQMGGLALLAARLPWAALFATLYLAYFLLINGPIGSPKYRLPMEPVLIVLQSYVMAHLISWLRRRRAKRPRPAG